MFKKSIVVGISVSPEKGLELAQIDSLTNTVIKYSRRTIDYNMAKREIVDLDIFKETLQDLLEDMAIPKGSYLSLTFPSLAFKVAEYPASLDELQIENAIEEELYENPYLKNYEASFGYIQTSSTLQFNSYIYTAARKSTIIEILLTIKDLGYKIESIDTSVNSTLRSLIYLDLVNSEPNTNWVLLTIDNNCCRVMSMLGKKIVDYFEENISIGEVLGDTENYATVISAVEPLLNKLPSKYLCVVSKTNVISAEIVANKITYSSPVIYQEANNYLKEPLLQVSPLVEQEHEKDISLDVIGAAIYRDFTKINGPTINLFNKGLGDIYFSEQPLTILNGKIALTNELLMYVFTVFSVVMLFLLILVWGWLSMQQSSINNRIEEMQSEINSIQQFLEQNKGISSSTFDEGDEIKIGLVHNKSIYSYYTIVGTEIPQKLWLTHLKLGEKITIEGQADNLESVYVFFRNIKDYNTSTDIRIQKLEMANLNMNQKDDDIDSDILITSSNADFYSFVISNEIEQNLKTNIEEKENNDSSESKQNKKVNIEKPNLPELEVLQ